MATANVSTDLVGQPHVKKTLVHALERNQVAHAYLLCAYARNGQDQHRQNTGESGQLSAADSRRAVQCLSACDAITNGNSMDVEEIDAASNRGVDEIRQLREKVQYAPTVLKRKVYIVGDGPC